MYPLDDDNLDRLSREAAEHFEAEAGASGWDHLEQRLNKELPQEKKRRRFLFWLILITAVTGGALTGILKYQQPAAPLANNEAGAAPGHTPSNNTTQTISGNNNVPKAAEQKEGKQPAASNRQATTAATEPATGASSNNNNNNQAVTNQVTAPNNASTQPVEKTKGNILSKPTGVHIQKAPATLNYAAIAPDNDNGANPSFNKTSKQKPGKRTKNKGAQNNKNTAPVTENNTAETENSSTNVIAATTEKPADATNEAAATQPAAAQQTDAAKSKPVVTPAADSAKTTAQQTKKDDQKKNKTKQPLELGIMVGPDMSTVSFGPLYKPGYNIGLQAGYRFSNHWSVNAGVIYTKKFYKADSTQFHYKDNPWPNARTINNVEGSCSMWDIPVNVRYDFSYNNKRRWFVSTGLSTYLMDKENYDMYYRWNGGPVYTQPLNSDSNSNYLFSIWNLSVGMERSLGKRFSLQAEPYLKVPLTGLGKGSMRMDSYGILFTLKYKPFFKAKKSDNK